MKEIHIQPVLNGFIVKVGCTKVVFDDINVLCEELIHYHRDPQKVEAEYLKRAINKGQCPQIAEPENIAVPRECLGAGLVASEEVARTRR